MKTLRFYVVVSVTGAVIMALEILSSRILAIIARTRMEIVLDPTTAVLLTDRFAPANHLIAVGSRSLDMPTPSD